jgi:peptide/nickel transport system permease protein
VSSYLYRRVALALLTTLFVSALSFAIIQLPPGDFVTTYIAELAADKRKISEERVEALRAQYGLDQSVFVQYVRWMGQVLHGNFGISLDWNRPVMDVIGDRLALTFVISFVSIMVTWIVALPIGVLSALRQYSIGDYFFTFIAFLGIAVPDFLLALLALYLGFLLFGVNIGGLFSPAYVDASWGAAKVWDLVKHLPLPVIILAVTGTGWEIRILRANLLDEMRKPYVITARSRGLRQRKLVLKYPVRVALNPFVSSIGFLFPQLVSGSVIVSLVLSLPTVGPVFLRALQAQDMFLAGTIVLMLGTLTVIGVLVSDLMLMWLDPRIRHARITKER